MNTQSDYYILIILLYITSSLFFVQVESENETPTEPSLNSNSEIDWCSKDICFLNDTAITGLDIRPLKKLSEYCPFLFPYGIFRIRICCETHEFSLLWNIFKIVMKSMDKCKQCLEPYKNLICDLAVHVKNDITSHSMILYDSNIKFFKK